ncbi:hypothetical protein Tco_1318781 [Tanacetum coccineum]
MYGETRSILALLPEKKLAELIRLMLRTLSQSIRIHLIQSDLIASLLNRDSSISFFSLRSILFSEEFSVKTRSYRFQFQRENNETIFDPEEEIRLVEKLLYDNSSPRPLEELNSENSNIKSFSPSPIPVEDSDSLMEEIDLFFTPDDSMPPGIENDDYDSEGDILFLEPTHTLGFPMILSFRKMSHFI